MGGCKTYRGRKTYQRTRSPEKFWTPPKEPLVCSVVDSCTGKTEPWHLRGVESGKRTVWGGPKPLLGGCHSWGFPPPSFSHPLLGRIPSTAGTFRKKFRKNSGKTPETLSERFLEFPSGVRLGSPKPYNSRHLRLPEHFQNSLPPVRLGTPLFSEVVPERASQSWSWNSQQYWGYSWPMASSDW